MKITNKLVLGLVVALLLLVIGLISGYKYYAHTHPIETTHDTILVYDTLVHQIPVDIHHYHQIIDTVYVPQIVEIPANVDTAAILKDYFSIYEYKRSWQDSTISVYFSDFISQNKIKSSTLLNYKLLKPQTTIINNTEVKNYHSYLNISASSDFKIKYPEIRITYISKNISAGVGVLPVQQTLTLNLGYNILKIK